MRRFFLLIGLCCLFLIGCSNGNNTGSGTIGYLEAKEYIINNGAILIDVRSSSEYENNHIEGATLLTLDKIDEDTATEVIGDYDTYVIVYCKSGVRSSQAKQKLNELGYNKVYDLGSIDNWKE